MQCEIILNLFASLGIPASFQTCTCSRAWRQGLHAQLRKQGGRYHPKTGTSSFVSLAGLFPHQFEDLFTSTGLHRSGQARIQVLADGTPGTRFENRPHGILFYLNKYSVIIQKRAARSHCFLVRITPRSNEQQTEALGEKQGGRDWDAQGESESESNARVGQKMAVPCSSPTSIPRPEAPKLRLRSCSQGAPRTNLKSKRIGSTRCPS